MELWRANFPGKEEILSGKSSSSGERNWQWIFFPQMLKGFFVCNSRRIGQNFQNEVPCKEVSFLNSLLTNLYLKLKA